MNGPTLYPFPEISPSQRDRRRSVHGCSWYSQASLMWRAGSGKRTDYSSQDPLKMGFGQSSGRRPRGSSVTAPGEMSGVWVVILYKV